MNYTVAANNTGLDRSGTMTVAGQTVTFTQSGTGCGVTVTPTTVTVPSIAQTSALSWPGGGGALDHGDECDGLNRPGELHGRR